MFVKKKKEKSGIEKMLETSYDYDGYDICFREGVTDPALYREVNALFPNGLFDLTELETFRQFEKVRDEDTFNDFYDEWLEELRKRHFVFYLDNSVSIEELTEGINEILLARQKSTALVAADVVNAYRQKLSEFGVAGDTIYYLLEANTAAAFLRKADWEFISLFNGFDNHDVTVILIEEIEKMKALEKKICGA